MTCETDGQSYTWRLVSGDDSTRVFEYRDSDDQPIDLTGYTASLWYDVGATQGNITGTIEEVAGKVTVTLPDEVTVLFKGNGEFRLRLTSSGGLKYTLVYGPLVVKL